MTSHIQRSLMACADSAHTNRACLSFITNYSCVRRVVSAYVRNIRVMLSPF